MNKVHSNIWIGNSRDARIPNGTIDANLNVALDLIYSAPVQKYVKVGLVDGPGNEQKDFNLAVDILDELIKKGNNVLVHCHSGVSRSVSVVTVYLAKESGRSFDEVLLEIQAVRPVANPHLAIVKLAKKYLGE